MRDRAEHYREKLVDAYHAVLEDPKPPGDDLPEQVKNAQIAVLEGIIQSERERTLRDLAETFRKWEKCREFGGSADVLIGRGFRDCADHCEVLLITDREGK